VRAKIDGVSRGVNRAPARPREESANAVRGAVGGRFCTRTQGSDGARAPLSVPALLIAVRGLLATVRAQLAACEFRATIDARDVDRTRAPLPRCSGAAAGLLSELLGVAATSGWATAEDFRRVSARHSDSARTELVAIGCVCPCDEGAVYVYPLAVVARAALLATGAVP